MTAFTRLCLVLGGLFIAVTFVYWYLQHEHLGTSLLAMTSGGFILIGLYGAAAVRKARRQTDAPATEEPHVRGTIWPAVFAVSAAGLTLGLLVAPWLLVVGGLLFAAAAVGWTAEARRQWRHDDHGATVSDHAQSGDEV